MRPVPALSDGDFDELSDWLTARGKGIIDVVELEGFLTAIVIGPNTLQPGLWLPKVWGGKQMKFRSPVEQQRTLELVFGLYNDVVYTFQSDPGGFEPAFYESKGPGRKVLIVDEWCWGFMKGVRLNSAAWKPLKQERPDLLKPLTLFGTTAGFREIDAGDPVKMHRTWSPRIAPVVREIYAYWLPHRRLTHPNVAGPLH